MNARKAFHTITVLHAQLESRTSPYKHTAVTNIGTALIKIAGNFKLVNSAEIALPVNKKYTFTARYKTRPIYTTIFRFIISIVIFLLPNGAEGVRARTAPPDGYA